MPNYKFVPYNDLEALARAMDEQVAAVILEPIQGGRRRLEPLAQSH
jgi:acetylornithine/N-succinyldiaminopimelate aminotransferase